MYNVEKYRKGLFPLSDKENMNLNENAEAEVNETAADKNNSKKETNIKSLIFRCAAGVLCTAFACVAVTSGINSVSDAKVKVAELTPAKAASSYVSAGTSAGTDSTGGDSYAVSDADSTTVDDSGSSSADSYDVADDTSASSGTDSTASADSTAGGQSSKPAADASSMNKAQIVALFNNAANGAKTNAKSIKQNYTKNTQVTSIELKNKMLASVADKLIAANMGEDESKHNKTYTGGDKAGYFPVAGQSWASKLTEADVKTATVDEKNGTYSVVIKLVDDTQPNLKVGEGHAGKAISLVTKEQIVEGAGSVGMAFIEEESIKVSHSNCTIKVTIDKATGKLKTANYYRDWKLQLTAIGIDVGITFGIEEDYVINW